MKGLFRPTLMAMAIAVIVLTGFLFWYSQWGLGIRSPLTAQEQAAYVERVEALQDVTYGFLKPAAIRDFLATDDGRPFFVINVFRFKPVAIYPDERASTATGREAFDQFSKAILPLWIKRAAHPVFVTTPSASMNNDWDLVSVVRYRSRRDYIEIVTSDGFLNALPHRLAAAESNSRIQLPGRLVPGPVFIVILFCVFLVLIVYSVERRFNR